MQYDDRFLADLARLLRHGKEPLSQLVRDLNDPKRRHQVLHALEALMQVAPEVSSPPKPKPASRQQRGIHDIDLGIDRVTDPQRHDLLEDISHQLLASVGLRSKRALTRLAEELQIRTTDRDSRVRIVERIIEGIRNVPLPELERVRQDIKLLDRGSSESYKELARFITRGRLD